MAAIGKIRKHSGLLIAIIGIALAAFVLGDLFKSGGQGGRQNAPVGVVNGEEITYQEFSREAEKNVENARQNTQSGKLTEQQRYSIRKNTWDQMVKEIIMGEQYEELGVTVSSQELYDMVQGPNPHPVIQRNFTNPNTNQFEPSRVRQFLSNLDRMNEQQRQQWLTLEEYLKTTRRETKFNNLIANAYYMPDSLAKLNYMEKGKSANINFFGIKYQTVEDDEVEVTEADLKEYYNNNKERYRNEEEKRKIEYVVFDVQASKKDRREIENQVNELNKELETVDLDELPRFVNSVSDQPYDSSWKSRGELPARIENTMFTSEPGTKVGPYIENNAYHIAELVDVTYRPDSMKASHILIAYRGANRAQQASRTRQQAQQIADSLFNVVKNNPQQFEPIAQKHSDGPSGQKGGELGWFEDGAMTPAFNEAVVENNVGDIVLQETSFGYHIIKIEDKKEPVKKVRVAEIVRNIRPSNETYQDVYMESSAFAGENKTYEAFEEAIKEQGLNKRSTGFFGKHNNNIPGVDDARKVVRWVFDEETSEGDVSKIIDDGDSYLVAALTNIREKGILPFKDVKEEIEPLVRREKKADVIKKRISSKGGGSLSRLAGSLGAQIRSASNLTFTSTNLPGFGPEGKVIAKIFDLQEGEMSNPIEGNMAVYVVKVNSFQNPPSISNFKGTKESLARDFQREIMSRRGPGQIYQGIKGKAEIEDNTINAF